MSVLAVVNRKGGTGKSTLAIHLAAYCAKRDLPVLLADTDPNQSTQVWWRLRALRLPEQGAAISARAIDPRSLLRPPAGTRHVVLDTEGGLRGFALSRVVNQADVVLIPMCDALFDREAAAACWAELRAHPRVASGRCAVAAVGMRLFDLPLAEASLRQWAAAQALPFIGAVADNRCYARCAERGLSLFDLPADQVGADLAQWAPVIDWLKPLWLDRPARPERLAMPAEDLRIHRPVDRLAGAGPVPPASTAWPVGSASTAWPGSPAEAAVMAQGPRPARAARPAPGRGQAPHWLARFGQALGWRPATRGGPTGPA